MRGKLGIAGAFDGEGDLIDGLFEALERHGVDFTGFFRALAALLRGDGAPLAALLPESEAMASWVADWLTDRKSVVWGKRGPLRVDHGGRRVRTKKQSTTNNIMRNENKKK